ncbi:MAG: hypothetical protein R3F14_13945 [Polyangiaceae bacterium]
MAAAGLASAGLASAGLASAGLAPAGLASAGLASAAGFAPAAGLGLAAGLGPAAGAARALGAGDRLDVFVEIDLLGGGGRDRLGRLAPLDGLSFDLEGEVHVERADRRLIAHRQRASPHHRARLFVGVDVQHVDAELHRARRAAGDEARDAAEHARVRQARADLRHDRVNALDHDPLVPVEQLDALVHRRGVEIRPVEVVRDLDDGLVQRLARHRAEEAPPRGPHARERTEPDRALGVRRIEDVGGPRVGLGARPAARAHGVVLPADAAERALVDERDAVERLPFALLVAIAEHLQLLVEEDALARDEEAHRHPRRRLSLGRARVPREHDVGAREVRHHLGGGAHAAGWVVAEVKLGRQDRERLHQLHRALVNEGEHGLRGDRDVELPARSPDERASGHRSFGGDARSGDWHAGEAITARLRRGPRMTLASPSVISRWA